MPNSLGFDLKENAFLEISLKFSGSGSGSIQDYGFDLNGGPQAIMQLYKMC